MSFSSSSGSEQKRETAREESVWGELHRPRRCSSDSGGLPSGGSGNGTQQSRRVHLRFPLCYSCSLGVTSYCNTRLLSLYVSKTVALPLSSFAPAQIGSAVFKFWNLMFLTSAADKLDAEAFDEWIREVDVGSDGMIRYKDSLPGWFASDAYIKFPLPISRMMRQIAVTVATLLLVALEIPTGQTLPSTVPGFLWSPLEDGYVAIIFVWYQTVFEGSIVKSRSPHYFLAQCSGKEAQQRSVHVALLFVGREVGI
ncbi:hypothetical protein RHMOL_Rhmol08G0316700 [Rhododendron molle]|uniref:Uncharacterized protein n=1 Tax=Rhododendron molle TaxID=49168 RepID=A0ACC0MWN6_RHOML|nr:hypothetical protein RHMOL_Rhmol08G0316700 [Rhododendron molle]